MGILILNGIFAFVAGILLNFTPCVLPVVPLKVRAVLRELQSTVRSRVLAALALLSGSLTFFITLGSLTAYLGWKWGEIFQSKLFLSLLALFLFLSGVTMLLGLQFRLPQAVYKIPIHRYMGAFLTGVLAGVLSTPCSGPFLGGVLAYAMTQSAAVTIVLFTAIGFGLAFPYVGILLWPKGVKYLPTSGKTGVQIESILAFILIAGGVFFSQSILPGSLIPVLWGVFGVGVFVWALLSFKTASKISDVIAPSLMLMGVLWVMASVFLTTNIHALAWQPYSKSAMSLALAAGKPVLLEFTADWCLNCKVLETTTYASSKVADAAQSAGLAAFKVDMTDFNDEEKALLSAYGGQALPFAIVLNPEGDPIQTFSGIFSVESLIDALHRSHSHPK